MPPPLASSSVAAPPEAGTPSPDSPRMARVSPPATLLEVQLLCVLQLLAIWRRGFGGIPLRQEEDRLSKVESAQEVARTQAATVVEHLRQRRDGAPPALMTHWRAARLARGRVALQKRGVAAFLLQDPLDVTPSQALPWAVGEQG